MAFEKEFLPERSDNKPVFCVITNLRYNFPEYLALLPVCDYENPRFSDMMNCERGIG